MAQRGGHTNSDLTEVELASIDLFELMRRLETGRLRFGRSGGPDSEPARLGQPMRLSFAVSDVASFDPGDDSAPPRIAVNAIGLFGPEGPMPLHLTRWMMERASNRWFGAGSDDRVTSDTTFLDFGNMLQHRMIALYWRAWADTRPEVQISHGTGGAVIALIRALAGLGLPGAAEGEANRSDAKLRHATSLAQTVQGPERLTEYLATVAGVPVSLREFVGVWTAIPSDLQTRVGRQAATLARDAVVGARFFERQGRAEITLGPLSYDEYMSFLEEPSRLDELRHALSFAMGQGIEFDVRLALDASDVPDALVSSARLGQTGWLGRPEADVANDRCLRNVNRRQPEERRA